MALDHETAVRDVLADAIDTAVNASGAGNCVFDTSGDVEVATIVLSATAFGASSSGTITLASTTDDTSATGGTVAKFKFETGASTRIFGGTVTAPAGGGDMEMSSLSVGAGDTVSITSFTYSASA
jgi:hypothetical protein